MNYWWVNQNQTYKHEVEGGFMWSPKTKKNGDRNPFYDFMKDARPGDRVFSFCDARIKAIGTVTSPAETAVKPNFGGAGAEWLVDGWLVPTDFVELEAPVRPKDHINILRPLLPVKYSPLNASGDGSQSVYLTSVPESLAQALISLIGPHYAYAAAASDVIIRDVDAGEQQEVDAIKGRTDIGLTQKKQLVLSRRGQGVFKQNVRQNENRCRVTGVSDTRHLVASHIKPWSKSTDEEKLDGCNGLLLAPHIDHLFDRGHISFSDNGAILVSPCLRSDTLSAWGIDPARNVGSFNSGQKVYLAYHRQRFGFD